MGFATKPMAWLLLFALAAGCTGCGTYRWNKAGASDDDFKQDSAACDKSRSNDAGAFNACMSGLGWRLD